MSTRVSIFAKCLSNYVKTSTSRYFANKSAYEVNCLPKPEIKKPDPKFCLTKFRVRQEVPDCPRPCPPIPDKARPLTRLVKKFSYVRIDPCPAFVCPRRADDGMVFKMKTLPPIRPGNCVCVEPQPFKEEGGFRRLERKKILQKIPHCIPDRCPPRSDARYTFKAKVLPYMPPGKCKCIEPHLPTTLPPLHRLKKRPVPIRIFVPEWCHPPPCEKTIPLYRSKTLPKITSDCKCIEPPKLKSVPLVRLKKQLVCPPPHTKPCIVPDCTTPRADEVCEYKVRDKKLQTVILDEKCNHMSIYEYDKLKRKKKRQ